MPIPSAIDRKVPPAIRRVLRSPQQERLHETDGGFVTEAGDHYPIEQDVLCLLPAEQRDRDLGDGRFYDSYPFGECTNKANPDEGVEAEFRRLLADTNPSALILDAGCGAGRLSRYIDAQGFANAVNLDFSFPSLLNVRETTNNVCIWGNLLSLPFESGVFELVACTGVVHHTPDPYGALAECVRVLAPGGRLYLRVYNRRSPYRLLHTSGGSVLRAAHATRTWRWLCDDVAFPVYKWARKAVFSRREYEERLLQAKFGNLFLKGNGSRFRSLKTEDRGTARSPISCAPVWPPARQAASHR